MSELSAHFAGHTAAPISGIYSLFGSVRMLCERFSGARVSEHNSLRGNDILAYMVFGFAHSFTEMDEAGKSIPDASKTSTFALFASDISGPVCSNFAATYPTSPHCRTYSLTWAASAGRSSQVKCWTLSVSNEVGRL